MRKSMKHTIGLLLAVFTLIMLTLPAFALTADIGFLPEAREAKTLVQLSLDRTKITTGTPFFICRPLSRCITLERDGTLKIQYYNTQNNKVGDAEYGKSKINGNEAILFITKNGQQIIIREPNTTDTTLTLKYGNYNPDSFYRNLYDEAPRDTIPFEYMAGVTVAFPSTLPQVQTRAPVTGPTSEEATATTTKALDPEVTELHAPAMETDQIAEAFNDIQIRISSIQDRLDLQNAIPQGWWLLGVAGLLVGLVAISLLLWILLLPVLAQRKSDEKEPKMALHRSWRKIFGRLRGEQPHVQDGDSADEISRLNGVIAESEQEIARLNAVIEDLRKNIPPPPPPPPPKQRPLEKVIPEAYHSGSTDVIRQEGYNCVFVNVNDPGEADLTGQLYLIEQKDPYQANYIIVAPYLLVNPLKFKATSTYQFGNLLYSTFIKGCYEIPEQASRLDPLKQVPAQVRQAGEQLWLLTQKGQLW